jgi:hypothetical protein
MYGGRGGGLVSEVTGLAGVSSSVAGVALLPNTGGSVALTVLSIATIAAGGLITASFILARIAALRSR